MSATRKTSKSAIVDAAISLLAANPGTSLGQISQAAGVSRATLHRHFRTRAELIAAISLLCNEEYEAALVVLDNSSKKGRERLLLMLEAMVPLGDRFHFLISEPVPSDDPDAAADADGLARLERLVLELKADGDIRPEMPTAWAVGVIGGLIWAAWEGVHGGTVAAADAPGLVYRTVLSGLGGAE